MDSAIAPSPAHLYFLVSPRSNAWLPMVMPSLPKEDTEQSVEVAVNLGEERRHVGCAKRNAGGTDDLSADLFDFVRICVAR